MYLKWLFFVFSNFLSFNCQPLRYMWKFKVVVVVAVVDIAVAVLNVLLTTHLMMITRRFLGNKDFLKWVSRFTVKGDVYNKRWKVSGFILK